LEKETISQKLENDLDETASKKIKAEENLENIKNGIKRKINLKEKERDSETKSLEEARNQKISEINTSIFENKLASDKRIQEIKKEQTLELDELPCFELIALPKAPSKDSVLQVYVEIR
jgi:hypothetical protein